MAAVDLVGQFVHVAGEEHGVGEPEDVAQFVGAGVALDLLAEVNQAAVLLFEAAEGGELGAVVEGAPVRWADKVTEVIRMLTGIHEMRIDARARRLGGGGHRQE